MHLISSMLQMLQAHVGTFVLQSNGYPCFQPIKLIAKYFIDTHTLLHRHILHNEYTSAHPLGAGSENFGF